VATRHLVVIIQQLLPGPSELGRECPGGLQRREWGRGVAVQGAWGKWGRQLEERVLVSWCTRLQSHCLAGCAGPGGQGSGVGGACAHPQQLEVDPPGGPRPLAGTERDPPLLLRPQAAASCTAHPPFPPGCIQVPQARVGRCGFPAGA